MPAPGTPRIRQGRFVAGMLTQQVEKGDQNLGIGIVTQAQFIRDTLTLLDSPLRTARVQAPAAGGFATDTAASRP